MNLHKNISPRCEYLVKMKAILLDSYYFHTPFVSCWMDLVPCKSHELCSNKSNLLQDIVQVSVPILQNYSAKIEHMVRQMVTPHSLQ